MFKAITNVKQIPLSMSNSEPVFEVLRDLRDSEIERSS